MSNFSLVPQHDFQKITDISPAFLEELSVKFLMLDLDNTIAHYGERFPTHSVLQWAASMKKNNIELYIVSNSNRKELVEAFAEALGIGYIKKARKPSPKGLLQAMEATGFNPSESALVGDQIFTDTLAANRAGATSMIVRPLGLKNLFLFLRFAAETPFRTACVNVRTRLTEQGLGVNE